jgi:CubicO group peptidase (beta-lactamase class C family)
MMRRLPRTAVRLGLAAVLFVVLIGFPRCATAEDPAQRAGHGPRPLEGTLDVLGPGPLPPRTFITSPEDVRSKAATIADAIDLCVLSDMARVDAPGAAVAVVLDGQTIHTRGYGVKHRLQGGVVDADTAFRIGSVTKMMTAAAVMQQVELGRVDLDAPVTNSIPEFRIGGRWPADLITVRRLLTHTTGFPDLINGLYGTGDGALSRWAAAQGAMELYAPPGSFWNYSNPNFMLAGLVAERAAGVPYRDLYKQSLWEPAGMHHTTFSPAEVISRGNYANGYYHDAESNRDFDLGPLDNDFWAAGPAGFAFSTVGDLAQWALLLMDGGGPVLSPASAAVMQEPWVWQHYTPDLYYGFGIMIDTYQGLDIRQHGGNVAGFGTFLLWLPDRRFVVALLTNVTSSLDRAAYCIVDEVLEPDPVEEPDLTTDPATWRRYEGDYLLTEEDGTRWSVNVALRGEELVASVQDPEAPDATLTSTLVQLFLDTFLFDGNGDGTLDTDITFCDRRGEPGFTMWMRNRSAVGERQLTPRTGRRLTQ